MATNHRIKRFLFDWYALIAVLVFAVAMVFAISEKLPLEKFAAIAAGASVFAFSVQKQNLEETKLFKELFEQFNSRYDALNDELNRIYFDQQAADKQFKYDERETLYKYFNLCGEEWLYAKKGFICPEVWRAWENGMIFFRKIPRIRELWDKDLKETDSYYGLNFKKDENATVCLSEHAI